MDGGVPGHPRGHSVGRVCPTRSTKRTETSLRSSDSTGPASARAIRTSRRTETPRDSPGRTLRRRSCHGCSHSVGSPELRTQRRNVGPEFAEPVALSSTTPANFPLARTAARLGFVLLALRARRNRHCTRASTSRQGAGRESFANCGTSSRTLSRRLEHRRVQAAARRPSRRPQSLPPSIYARFPEDKTLAV